MHKKTQMGLCRALLALVLLCVFVSAEESESIRSVLERAEASQKEGYVNFSFDQVDVHVFVRLVGKITGKKFVVGDDVEGKITIVAPKVSHKEAYPLFVSILQSAGCSVIEDEGIYRVVPLAVRPTHMAPVIGPDEATPVKGLVTKVIRLDHVSAEELRKALESKIGGGKEGAIRAINDTNHLIVTDTAENIRRVEKLVAQIDLPGLSRVTEVIPLQYAGAEDLAMQLNAAMAESETRESQLIKRLSPVQGKSGATARTAFIVPSPHSNSLILVGTQSQILELKRIIKLMDVDTPSGRGHLNAIFLKYIAADEAAKSITALLTRSPVGSKNGAGGNRSAERDIAIEASMANNALLVDASPGDFEVVRKLIEQLDKMPQQVHIEVLIAEISVTDSLEFGIDMAALEMPSGVGDTVVQGGSTLKDSADSIMNLVQQGIFPKGLTIGVAHGSSLDSDGNVVASYPGMINIDAVKKDSRVNIRSQTSLEAQNNKEASVSIVDEIPILKSTIQGGSGASRDVIQNIDRIDVGIKLELTPHIIPGGEVQMVLNPSIEAVIDPGPAGTFAPTIAKREVSTTVTVADGRTIVIAGLTREDKIRSLKKVPILGSIPILGILFRHKVDSVEKTNLLIFVTPHIVTSMADADEFMSDWENKTGITPDKTE